MHTCVEGILISTVSQYWHQTKTTHIFKTKKQPISLKVFKKVAQSLIHSNVSYESLRFILEYEENECKPFSKKDTSESPFGHILKREFLTHKSIEISCSQ